MPMTLHAVLEMLEEFRKLKGNPSTNIIGIRAEPNKIIVKTLKEK